MIESYDIELFRAKLRAEFGSLAAILDGIDICQEHQLTLPRWLASRTAEILASVTYRRGESPVSDHHFKMERKHLALQQRMKLMREVLAYERGKEGYKGSPFHCEFAEALERVEVQVGIEKWSPSSMTDQEKKASEIVHHILKQTWAQAGADTIAVDYKSARTASIYSVDRLTRKQVDYLSWDLEAIRPSTFENLGISRVEIVSDPT
ncbi:hypothetical protein [Pseudoroseicyclus tamaricis]|uniref:hypothetical protein n=1 Tax=Pseudoroseicyclus tamaricis TaxID=2705421 RepID=UPI001432EE58|nr:hypothetical protein [Pseudoroseicyclus tamaricis]